MVDGEHRRDPLAIRRMHQRCVGEVHASFVPLSSSSRKASRAPVSASPSTRTSILQRRSHATARLFRSIRIAAADRSGTAERLVAHPELRRGVVSIRRVAREPVGDDRLQQARDARVFGASSPLQRLFQRRVEPPTIDFVLLHALHCSAPLGARQNPTMQASPCQHRTVSAAITPRDSFMTIPPPADSGGFGATATANTRAIVPTGPVFIVGSASRYGGRVAASRGGGHRVGSRRSRSAVRRRPPGAGNGSLNACHAVTERVQVAAQAVNPAVQSAHIGAHVVQLATDAGGQRQKEGHQHGQ